MAITAEPNSRILKITSSDPVSSVAEEAVRVAATAYLVERSEFVDGASASLQRRLDARQRELEQTYSEAVASLDEDGEGNAVVEATLEELRSQSQATVARMSAELPTADGAGRLLSDVRGHQRSDSWFIRTGTGVALGALVGLMLMTITDRRRHRLGDHPERLLQPYDIPTVATVSYEAVDDHSDGQLLPAERAIGAYLPLAGLLADPESAYAMALAGDLDANLESPNDHSGRRILLVAETGTRSERLVTLLNSCERNGLDPVGVILIR